MQDYFTALNKPSHNGRIKLVNGCAITKEVIPLTEQSDGTFTATVEDEHILFGMVTGSLTVVLNDETIYSISGYHSSVIVCPVIGSGVLTVTTSTVDDLYLLTFL